MARTRLFRRPASGVAAGDAIPFRHGDAIHLFFLSSPADTTDYPARVRTTWQHVRYDSMTEWQELPSVLAPGRLGTVDADGCWTGSVIEREGTFHLFYTGHRVGADHPQTICRATSEDLVTFTKDERNPLLLPPASCEPVDWRDPYVFFNEEEGRYWMIIAARLARGPRWTRGVIMLATSDDLGDWQLESEPLYVPGTTYCPECPELWPLDGRWYLVYSRFSEQAGTIYRVADSPRGPFRVPEDDELGGRRWYAAKSAPTSDGARLFFGWIHQQAADGRWYWGGDFSAPRLASPTTDGALSVRLPEAIEGALSRTEKPERTTSDTARLDGIGTQASRPIGPTDLPDAFLARCAFRVLESPAAFGLTIRADTDGGGWYATFDRVRGTVALANVPMPLDDFWADLVGRRQVRREVDGGFVAEARVPRDAWSNGIDCMLLVEGDLVELYVGDRVVLTHRIPSVGEAGRLGVFVVDGSVNVAIHLHCA